MLQPHRQAGQDLQLLAQRVDVRILLAVQGKQLPGLGFGQHPVMPGLVLGQPVYLVRRQDDFFYGVHRASNAIKRSGYNKAVSGFSQPVTSSAANSSACSPASGIAGLVLRRAAW